MLDQNIQNSEFAEQLKSLQTQLEKNNEVVKDLSSTVGLVKADVDSINSSVNADSGMINLINNGEFAFDDEGYNDADYADKNIVAAEWYRRPQSEPNWHLNNFPSTVSDQALKDDDFFYVKWDKAAGLAKIGGSDVLGQKLHHKYLTKGNQVYVRFQLSKDATTEIAPDIKLRVSIYDNTTGQKKIIEGSPKQLTANVQGDTGAFTRKYILEVVTPTGSFYSDITAPEEVNNAISVMDVSDPTLNYVNVSWTPVIEQSAYKLYRFDSEYNEWRLIAEITNGNTAFRDTGGRAGALFTVPSAQINPKAIAEILNIGSKIKDFARDTILSIRIPSDYDYSVTEEQWLQIEFLKGDNSYPDIADIPPRAIFIDKVGLSFANGRFVPSAKDQQTTAAITTTAPPPSTGGGGGGSYVPPEGGGGYDEDLGCVIPSTEITAVSAVTGEERIVPAREVYVGMQLLGKDKHGKLAVGRVKEIIRAKTTMLYTIITKIHGYELICSPTHPIIQNVDDLTGIHAHKLPRLLAKGRKPTILVLDDEGNLVEDEILAIEISNGNSEVLTFEMEDSTSTYISNRIVSHNRAYKPQYSYFVY